MLAESNNSEQSAAAAAAAAAGGGASNTGANSQLSSTNPLTALKSTHKLKYIRSERSDKCREAKFLFNIADGGFTELHTLWLNEERAATAVKGDQALLDATWHRRHDYWLLSGVCVHGYARWQDVQQDARFALITEPFRQQLAGGANANSLIEMKNKFLARRFKLIEQALVIEEQLRRASHMNAAGGPPAAQLAQQHVVLDPMSGQASSVLALNAKFAELESLADSHYHLTTSTANPQSTSARLGNEVLRRVLTQLEDLLNDMKQEVNRLPVSLARMPGVTERLRMQERDILNRLATFSGEMQQQQAPASVNDYAKYAQFIGPFTPSLASNALWNPNAANNATKKPNAVAQTATASTLEAKVEPKQEVRENVDEVVKEETEPAVAMT